MLNFAVEWSELRVWEISARNFDMQTGYSDTFRDFPNYLQTTALYYLKADNDR
jgi:hypothetical protein